VNGWVIKLAEKAVEEAGFSDVITIIRGYSTLLDLPERVDVVCNSTMLSNSDFLCIYHYIA
jgi:hypothetical protein